MTLAREHVAQVLQLFEDGDYKAILIQSEVWVMIIYTSACSRLLKWFHETIQYDMAFMGHMNEK